jgi:protein-tyrosine phosphatase
MMTQISDSIFIGNSQDHKRLDVLKTTGITAVYNVAADLNTEWCTEIVYVKCGLWDGPAGSNRIELAVDLLEKLVDGGERVLIHCHEGCNRSPYIVAKYLAKKNGTDWKKEFEGIKVKRPQVYIKDWMS